MSEFVINSSHSGEEIMESLSRLWTRVSYIYIAICIYFIPLNTGMFDKTPHGKIVSLAFGVLCALLLLGAAIIFITALYIAEAKQENGISRVPYNCDFEEIKKRSPFVTKINLSFLIFTGLITTAMAAVRYSESEIHPWGCETALAKGFLASRKAISHFLCDQRDNTPCFAMSQRYLGNEQFADGTWAYYPYVNDIILFCSIIIFFASMGFLLSKIK